MKSNSTKSPTKDNTINSAVSDAVRVLAQINELTAILEGLKESIRHHAIPLIASNKNSIRLETPVGICTVTKVKDALALTPGIDAESLQYAMPDKLWHGFFIEKPTLRPNAAELWIRLNAKQRKELGDPCPFQLQPRSAQVKLPK